MPNETKIRGRSTKGALYVPMHAERRVMIYPVEDSEMESLSDINNNVAFWYAIGGGGATAIVGCLWDIVSQGDQPSPSSHQLGFLALATIVAAFAFVVAWRYKSRGTARLAKIRSESQPVRI